MQKVIIKSTGETKLVSNNEAHSLIEKGIAELFKGQKIMKSPKDKMIRSRGKKKTRGIRIK